MSRGPGRLQRRILDVLAQVPPDERVRTAAMAEHLADEWGKGNDLADLLTFERQVRRALDSLHATGRVEKDARPNPYRPRSVISWWRLARA